MQVGWSVFHFGQVEDVGSTWLHWSFSLGLGSNVGVAFDAQDKVHPVVKEVPKARQTGTSAVGFQNSKVFGGLLQIWNSSSLPEQEIKVGSLQKHPKKHWKKTSERLAVRSLIDWSLWTAKVAPKRRSATVCPNERPRNSDVSTAVIAMPIEDATTGTMVLKFLRPKDWVEAGNCLWWSVGGVGDQ